MSHKSPEELFKKLQEASLIVEIGANYFHYKHPEFYYTIVDIVVEEATDEPMIIYQGMNNGLKFARPFRSFVEEIEVQGKIIKRFTKLN